jgi:hypothetical protein
LFRNPSKEIFMRQAICVLRLVIFAATAAFAATGDDVTYVGGSAVSVHAGDTGQFDYTAGKDLVFQAKTDRLAIGYDKVQKVEYRSDVTFHLGVLPAIAVGLVKKRERSHFLTLTYTDTTGASQAAVFEVAKSVPETFIAVVAARSPQACLLSVGSQRPPAVNLHACRAH